MIISVNILNNIFHSDAVHWWYVILTFVDDFEKELYVWIDHHCCRCNWSFFAPLKRSFKATYFLKYFLLLLTSQQVIRNAWLMYSVSIKYVLKRLLRDLIVIWLQGIFIWNKCNITFNLLFAFRIACYKLVDNSVKYSRFIIRKIQF